ncbi:hypothetical protein GCM10027047_21240 [Rhodococcus aerolatus]
MRVGDPAAAADLVAALGAGTTREDYGRTEVVLDPADWVRAATTARDALGAAMFDHLGVHDPGRPDAHGDGWQVHCHVLAPARAATLWLVTVLGPDEPLPSLTGVWAGAAWHEREAAEMAGLAVTGHPDLRPLLLAEGVGTRPLRKDALLVGRAVRPWPGRLEPGEEGGAPTSGRRRATAPGLPPAGWGQP